MNLDMVISRELKRSPMENALHGVVENLGGQYQLKALPSTVAQVEDLFGTDLGNYTTGGVSRPSYKEAAPPIENYADFIDGYTLVYERATKKWGLYNGVIKNNNNNGLLGKMARFLRGESATADAAASNTEIIKYGEGSGHRFLSALETADDIPHIVKVAIAERVVSIMSGVMPASSITADSVNSTISNGAGNGSSSNGAGNGSVAGTTPVSGSTMTNGAMELNLAETYTGVSKQRNSTFMGDTVIPSPLSNAQVQQHSSAISFNQNNVGLINRPPTKIPAAGKFTKTSRSF